MTTFNPVGHADGELPNWTPVNGNYIGKAQASRADRFCVTYPGSGFTDDYFTRTVYQTPTSSRANHYLATDFILEDTGDWCSIIFNSNSGGTSKHEFGVNGNGSWFYDYDGGGMNSGGAGSLAVTAGVSFTLSVDAANADNPVCKFNGSTVSVGTATNSRTGLYVGVALGDATTGAIQIEPAGGAATLVEEKYRVGYQQFNATTQAVTFASTPANGNLIVLEYVFQDATPASRTWPTGFTEFIGTTLGTSEFDVAAAWKIASSEGSATYTLSLGGTGDTDGQYFRGQVWSGTHATTPIDVVGTVKNLPFVNNTETFFPNDVTTTVADVVLVVLVPGAGSALGITRSGFTQMVHGNEGPSDNRFLQLQYGTQASAGASGNVVMTVAGGYLDAVANTIMFGIRPAGSGGAAPATLATTTTTAYDATISLAPTVFAVGTVAGGTNMSSAVTMNMPTHAVGDLLICFVAHDSATLVSTATSGWVRPTPTVSTGITQVAYFAKLATSSSETAIAVVGANQDYVARVYCIRNHGVVSIGTTAAASDLKWTATTAASGNADPASYDAGASKDWLWFAVAAVDCGATGDTLSAVPAGYVDSNRTRGASSATSVWLGVGYRGIGASQTQDPGAFTNTSRTWAAYTLAVPHGTVVQAGVATATGTSYGANLKAAPVVSSSTSTGTAYDAAIAIGIVETFVNAGLATTAGTGYGTATKVSPSAGLTSTSPAAYSTIVTASPIVGLASTAGTAYSTGTRVDPAVELSSTTVNAYGVTATPVAVASVASATAAGFSATLLGSSVPSLATVTAIAHNATTGNVNVTAGLAISAVTASSSAVSSGVASGLAMSTGAGYDITGKASPVVSQAATSLAAHSAVLTVRGMAGLSSVTASGYNSTAQSAVAGRPGSKQWGGIPFSGAGGRGRW